MRHVRCLIGSPGRAVTLEVVLRYGSWAGVGSSCSESAKRTGHFGRGLTAQSSVRAGSSSEPEARARAPAAGGASGSLAAGRSPRLQRGLRNRCHAPPGVDP